MARQAVVRDGLPARGIRDELPPLWADPRITVDGAEANARVLVGSRRAREERGAAPAAEDLLAAALGSPASKLLGTAHDPHGAGYRASVGRGRRPAAPLAARAMAVDGCDERGGHLEADGAAAASSGDRVVHDPSLREACARRTRPAPRAVQRTAIRLMGVLLVV